MRKRMIIMIILLLVIFGGIFAWNIIRAYFMRQYFANFQPPPATVSTITAQPVNWQSYLNSVGTLSASNGVDITPEVAGTIVAMPFESGQMVKKGDLLVKLDDGIEQAQLLNDTASLQLAKINHERMKDLYQKKAASRSQLDEAEAKLTQAQSAVTKTKVLIAQKNITAPFDGKVGIKLVDTWQFVGAGTALVTLQAVEPMKVNFYLPEQNLPELSLGQTIKVKVEAYPNKDFQGSITAINAKSNSNSHTILIQGTLPNAEKLLVPGFFADLKVMLAKSQPVIVIPESAVDFSLFGNTVYVVVKQADGNTSDTHLVVKRRFVVTGERQAGKVVISKGLNAGEEIVTSGQMKLSDDSLVTINNTTQPV